MPTDPIARLKEERDKLLVGKNAYMEQTRSNAEFNNGVRAMHAAALTALATPEQGADDREWERVIRWLDAAEGRTLLLVSANADFDGPSYVMEYSTLEHEPKQVFGETREEIIACIEEITL